MKYLLLILLVFAPGVMAENWKDKTYITIGAAYKFSELDLTIDGEKWNDPYTARVEVGYVISRKLKIGISHHSQWLSGAPFNAKGNGEYHKTELFIDYTFTLSDLF